MQIKVMNYNLHSGIGTDRKADWKRIAEIVKAENPDLLGAEEVSNFYPETRDLDFVKTFSEYLKMAPCFGMTMSPDGVWQFGNAGFSKEKMEVMGFWKYDCVPQKNEPRGFIIMKILSPEPYYFAVTHVPFQKEMEGDEKIRLQCFQKLTEVIEKNQWYPAVLAGDFNTYPGTETIEWLHTKWDVCNDCDTATPTAYCRYAGWRQIDFICTYPKGFFRLKEFHFVENLLASDHRPAVAVLETVK